MIDLHTLPCPVCGTTGSQIVHSVTYPEQRYPGTFVLRRCNGCGLLFNSPRLDLNELGKLYDGNYYFFLRSDAREFRRIVGMYQRTLGVIDVNAIEKRSLDIGCGRGYFPAVLKSLGWDAHGVEISEEASEYARAKFSLDVFTGTIEQYASGANARTFPLVTAIDVIEHVPDPAEFVAAAAKCVAPGGMLIIDTPNAQANNVGHKGAFWKGFNPFHIYLFSIDNLKTLLQRNGMRVESGFSYGNSPEPRNARDGMISLIKKLHLAGPAAKAYFAIKKMTMGRHEPAELISRAASAIGAESSYSKSSDSNAPLSQSKSGDNIVVIARKD